MLERALMKNQETHSDPGMLIASSLVQKPLLIYTDRTSSDRSRLDHQARVGAPCKMFKEVVMRAVTR